MWNLKTIHIYQVNIPFKIFPSLYVKVCQVMLNYFDPSRHLTGLWFGSHIARLSLFSTTAETKFLGAQVWSYRFSECLSAESAPHLLDQSWHSVRDARTHCETLMFLYVFSFSHFSFCGELRLGFEYFEIFREWGALKLHIYILIMLNIY